jgi:hypothetical protein
MKRIAICVGLTKVDPNAYGGWTGECPGCDLDMDRFANLCRTAGFDSVSTLLTENATKAKIFAAMKAAAKKLVKGDLLVLFNSGHGGQQPDTNGDEADGSDETICWYDGELVDDEMGKVLATFKTGVRVLFVADTCNSGTNYRGRRGRRKLRPMLLSAKATAAFRGALVHFGGCSDGRSSYGADNGGAWTNALLSVKTKARKPLTYRQWFDRAAAKMPASQKPAFGEWGGPSFAKDVALT